METVPEIADVNAEQDVELGASVLSGLHKLVWLLNSEFQQVRVADGVLTPQQLGVLRDVRNGPLPIYRIARRRGISSAAVSLMVNRLAARGLVQKVSDPNDGRNVLVASTPAGEHIRLHVYQRGLARISEVVGRLTPDGRRHLALGMAEFNRLIREDEGGRDPE